MERSSFTFSRITENLLKITRYAIVFLHFYIFIANSFYQCIVIIYDLRNNYAIIMLKQLSEIYEVFDDHSIQIIMLYYFAMSQYVCFRE